MPRSKERNSKKTRILNWYICDMFVTVAYISPVYTYETVLVFDSQFWFCDCKLRITKSQFHTCKQGLCVILSLQRSVCIIRKVILNLTQVQQMIRNKMTKLFADYELKRQKMEEVDANDRYVQGERS